MLQSMVALRRFLTRSRDGKRPWKSGTPDPASGFITLLWGYHVGYMRVFGNRLQLCQVEMYITKKNHAIGVHPLSRSQMYPKYPPSDQKSSFSGLSSMIFKL
jgi:hypothetical protein